MAQAMRQAPSLVLVVVTLVLAGCTEPYDKEDDASGEEPDCTPGIDGCPCPEDTRLGEGGCQSVNSILFDIHLAGTDTYEVGVPFPHGAWCLTGDDWLEGMQETKSLEEYSVRDVERGKVLWLQGRGEDSRFVARVDVTNRTECQTLRYDPWSVDPDAAEGTMEATSEALVNFTVYVRTARGGCVDLRQYMAEVSGGWQTLPETFNNDAGCA